MNKFLAPEARLRSTCSRTWAGYSKKYAVLHGHSQLTDGTHRISPPCRHSENNPIDLHTLATEPRKCASQWNSVCRSNVALLECAQERRILCAAMWDTLIGIGSWQPQHQLQEVDRIPRQKQPGLLEMQACLVLWLSSQSIVYMYKGSLNLL